MQFMIKDRPIKYAATSMNLPFDFSREYVRFRSTTPVFQTKNAPSMETMGCAHQHRSEESRRFNTMRAVMNIYFVSSLLLAPG